MSEVPPGKKRAVSDDSNTAQTVGWKLRSMLSAKYGAAAVNSNSTIRQYSEAFQLMCSLYH